MGFFDAITADSEQHGRETAHLQTVVPAGTTDWIDAVTWEPDDDATVVKFSVWHVPNSADDLRTNPVRKQKRRERPLASYAGDGEEFITGEPQDSVYQSDTELGEDDKVVVKAQNQNSNYDYRFVVRVTVDYAGGTDRVLGPRGGAR